MRSNYLSAGPEDIHADISYVLGKSSSNIESLNVDV